MPSFVAPVLITDEDGKIGAAIGATPVALGGIDPAGVILANTLVLFGAGGLDAGRDRLRFLAEPGLIEVTGDDGAKIRLDVGGSLSIEDGAGVRVAINRDAELTLKNGEISIVDDLDRPRVFADANGALRLADGDTQSIVLNAKAGTLQIANSVPGFSSGVLLDSTGSITITNDALSDRTVLSASGGSTFSKTVSFLDNIAVGGGAAFQNISVAAKAVFRNNVEVDGDVILTGADCAENFDVADAHELDPGTVVVIDTGGRMTKSCCAYDRRVAGILSGAGDFRPGIILDKRESSVDRMPLALIGKAYCKVDADSAPIEVGDLLTTSETPGHAMRVGDVSRAVGAILGKALQPLARGRGLIRVLVTLQ